MRIAARPPLGAPRGPKAGDSPLDEGILWALFRADYGRGGKPKKPFLGA